MEQTAIYSDKQTGKITKKPEDAEYERRLKQLKEKYGEA